MVKVLAILGFFLVAALPVYAVNCGEPGNPACISDVVNILRNIIKLLAPATGLAFFVMLIYGGFQFVTSGGDPKSVAHARNTMTFAVIGIILVVASWLILSLVANITGTTITTVKFP